MNTMWNDSPILVTGATGFVGSCLVRSLKEQGVKVYRMGLQPRLDEEYIQADLTSAEAVEKAFQIVQPGLIFHCASYGVQPGQQDEAKMKEINVLGTKNVLRACEQIRPRAIVMAGSWTEYKAKNDQEPFVETDMDAPVSSYGQSRREATLYATEWSHAQQIPLQVLRFSQLYGSEEPQHRLMPTLLRSLLTGVSAKLGSSQTVRDFLSVEEAARALCWAAEQISLGQIINIGSGRATSLKDLVTIFQRLFPSFQTPEWGEPTFRPWDVPIAYLDVSLANRLGWRNQISLEEGIKKMVQDCQKQQNLLN